MPSPSELRIHIADRDLKLSAFLGNPAQLDITVKANGTGYGTIDIESDNVKLPRMLADGARIQIEFRGEHLTSGPLLDPVGEYGQRKPVKFTVRDDWRRLQNTVALIAPTGNLTATSLTDWAQTTRRIPGTPDAGTLEGNSGYYQWPDGQRETRIETREGLIKDVVAKAFDRLEADTPWLRGTLILPNQGRGGSPWPDSTDPKNGLPNIRQRPLEEAILPLLNDGDLIAQLWQPLGEDQWRFETRAARTFRRPLSLRQGAVTSGKWSRANPTNTRIIAGGPGEDVDRLWYLAAIDRDLERRFGDIIEVTKDVTQDAPEWPDAVEERFRVYAYFLLNPNVPTSLKNEMLNTLTTSGLKALAEGAPTASTSAELQETPTSRFMGEGGYRLGDTLTIEDGPLSFSDRITECRIVLTPRDGLRVIPTIGEKKNDPHRRLWATIGALYADRSRSITGR